MQEKTINNIKIIYPQEVTLKDHAKREALFSCSILAICVIYICLIIVCINIDPQSVLGIGFIDFGLILYLVIGTFIIAKIKNIKKHKYYSIIIWFINKDYMEVGYFYNRYMLRYHSYQGVSAHTLDSLFHHEKYKLIDYADKNKPIYLEIDFTKEQIYVTAKN